MRPEMVDDVSVADLPSRLLKPAFALKGSGAAVFVLRCAPNEDWWRRRELKAVEFSRVCAKAHEQGRCCMLDFAVNARQCTKMKVSCPVLSRQEGLPKLSRYTRWP